jgi:alkylation response protein AidB-like acyl-CoA dehydrogenase
MNLEPSDLQYGIAETAREILQRTGHAGPGWAKSAELGWLGIAVPEESGGLGLGLPEQVMLFRELGRHRVSGPYLGSALGAWLAARAGEPDLARSICAGSRPVGLAVGDLGIDVAAGEHAHALRLASDGDSGSIVECRADAALEGTDPHTSVSRLTVMRSLVEVVDSGLRPRARVLLAAQCLGVIEAVRDDSANYARTRRQFGQPIGAFQAVKHRCADMAITEASTTGQVFQAALYVEHGHPDAAFHAAVAYLLAARGARACAESNIQNHGGIGFTWEHHAHFFVKRALVLENALGPLSDTYQDILDPPRHDFR